MLERFDQERSLASEPLEAYEALLYDRASSPAPGRSLGATVSRVGGPLRRAVERLATQCVPRSSVIKFLRSATICGLGGIEEAWPLRVSWFAMSVALARRALNHPQSGGIASALEWFHEDAEELNEMLRSFAPASLRAADEALDDAELAEHCDDLLPYLLEPHGHITRNLLATSAVAAETRTKKKADGIYYTPSDVAEFMVASISEGATASTIWLDPACGTGVFLRAIARQMSALATSGFGTSVKNIYGIDISALATDLAATVLMVEALKASPPATPPSAIWREIKQNLCCADSLRVEPLDRSCLGFVARDTFPLGQVFPSGPRNGFDRIVMNPPYATVQADWAVRQNWHSYSLAEEGQMVDAQLAFTEMIWRLCSKRGRGAAVLPLSIGANTSQNYRSLRKALACSGGKCEFLFFDREPQALFGEDIKTRNIILFRDGQECDTKLYTSRLLKWTAKQRKSIFTRSRLVPVLLRASHEFIPKLGSCAESRAYSTLGSAATGLQAKKFAPAFSRIRLAELHLAAADLRSRAVLVGSTAYNFINAFRAQGIPTHSASPYSASPVNCLNFQTKEDAFAGFSILSSRLCFWLWHVEGDGFHLTLDFLRRLPMWAVLASEDVRAALTAQGEALWNEAMSSRQSALNAGKQTYSFRIDFSGRGASEVERLIARELRLDEDIHTALDEFVAASVSIDGACRTPS